MDCVYVVKRSSDSENLRYSLRSLKNLPHDQVIIAGYKPDWCVNVIHIPVNKLDYTWAKHSIRYHDAEVKWVAACLDDRVSESFYAMNDDFYILDKVDKLPYYNRGRMADYLADLPKGAGANLHNKAIKGTYEFLKSSGYYNPLNYELHLPIVMEKSERLMINRLMQPLMKSGLRLLPRSIYGNIFELESIQREDVKNLKKFDNLDFLSSDRQTFKGDLGDYVRSLFREPSIYEA